MDKIQLLIIDDNPGMRRAIKKTVLDCLGTNLTFWPWFHDPKQIHEAGNAFEALQILDKDKDKNIRIIISDMIMAPYAVSGTSGSFEKDSRVEENFKNLTGGFYLLFKLKDQLVLGERHMIMMSQDEQYNNHLNMLTPEQKKVFSEIIYPHLNLDLNMKGDGSGKGDNIQFLRKIFDEVVGATMAQMDVSRGTGERTYGKLLIAGNSKPFKKAFNEALSYARNVNTPVTFIGESGTGKELMARFIHDNSSHSSGNLCLITCNMPSELIESELFGHKKGAFTGANTDKEGMVRHAHGGTIVFDEIGVISPGLQAKLLRFLSDGVYRPVGDVKEYYSNARIICNSNIPLEELVNAQMMKWDFYHRIRNHIIVLPALRDRREEIPLIANYIYMKHSILNGSKKATLLAAEDLKALEDYEWPGNLRELDGILENYEALQKGTEKKSIKELLDERRAQNASLETKNDNSVITLKGASLMDSWSTVKGVVEREYARYHLATNNGNVDATSRKTGFPEHRLSLLKRELYK